MKGVGQDKTVRQQSDTLPFSHFEWILAWRYLRARRQEGFISVIASFSFLGILLGVATLVIVMAVMNGFREELYGKMLGLNGHVIAHANGKHLTDYAALSDTLLALKNVTNALPVVEGKVMVSTPAHAIGGLVRAVREDDLKKLAVISKNIQPGGTLDGFGTRPPTVIIGVKMAEKLKKKVGQFITLINPRGTRTRYGRSPRMKRYRIRAIFKIGMADYDSSVIFMPLAEGQSYFNRKGRVDAIEILVKRPGEVKENLVELAMAMPPGISLVDWTKRNEGFFNELNVQQNVMFLILTLIVLVAALNIISGITMLVQDKSRDIAVLRTMGATRGSILRIFLITGASIGIAGTVVGVVVGIIFSDNIEAIRQFVTFLSGGADPFNEELYFLDHIPARVDVSEVVYVALMAFGLTVLATLYPAWRAAQMDPVEALRYE